MDNTYSATVPDARRMVNSQFSNIALSFTQSPNYYLRQNPIDLWSSAEPKHDWSAESLQVYVQPDARHQILLCLLLHKT